jgi:putative hydrolase of the HAD superfamily
LDHTLWDHQSNANETLADIYNDFELERLSGFNLNQFQDTFHKINHNLWHEYHLGRIDQAQIRNTRFKKVLSALDLEVFDSDMELAEKYLSQCPCKSNLMPHALEVLDYLKERYPMTIITNGFDEIQHIKMVSSGLIGYFDLVITSERSGWLKPHHKIFDFAVQHARVSAAECLMIGDNPATDIKGARAAGIDQIYYDPGNHDDMLDSTYRIQSLLQLKELL